MSFDRIDRQFRPRVIRLECTYCSDTAGVEHEPCRMVHQFTVVPGSKDDPNKPIPLCRQCAPWYHQQWDAMDAERLTLRI